MLIILLGNYFNRKIDLNIPIKIYLYKSSVCIQDHEWFLKSNTSVYFHSIFIQLYLI